MSKSKKKLVDISIENLKGVVYSQKTVTFYYWNRSWIELQFKFNKEALEFYNINQFFGQNRPSINAVEVIGIKTGSEIERLTAENATFKSEIEESNGLLRSAFMIAKRDGNDTNWEAFRGQLSTTLLRQHKMMYGDAEQALKEELSFKKLVQNMSQKEYENLMNSNWIKGENENSDQPD